MSKDMYSESYLLEQLVGELLKALGFVDVISCGTLGTPDNGFDIQAIYPSESSVGEIQQLWIVQVKHMQTSRVSTDALRTLSAVLKRQKADKALLVTSGNLTSAAKEYISGFNSVSKDRIEIWDRDKLIDLISQFPDIQRRYEGIISRFPLSLSAPQKPYQTRLHERLTKCQPGRPQWREFEQVCVDILTEVFVPPLKLSRDGEQLRTLSGLERRDALFGLRGVKDGWEEIRQEFDANFLLCEFKNYSELFGKNEVNQTRNYLKRTIGRLGMILSRKGADSSAFKMRNSIYAEEKKVILFFEDRHLIELIKLKTANQNPLDLIQDAIDDFYISHE